MTIISREVTFAEIEGLISSQLGDSVDEDGKRILLTSASRSTILWVAMDDQTVLGICGLISPTILADEGYLWLHTTNGWKEHSFMLILHSRRVVRSMLKLFPVIVGHCESHAERSQAWLRLLGAKFGKRNGPVIPFEIRSA